jgi:F-box/leucine-rich repeat protein 7
MCGANVKHWRMKSVWDITGQAILEMSNRAKGLEEIDLSNCRKVSDTLLARVVGWVVPEFHPMYADAHQAQLAAAAVANNPSRYIPPQIYPPAGTVIGCPNLRRLTLSYCKHVTDRTMSHLAAHASKRLEHVDLTRCTTITDQGFQSWSMTRFERLQSLCLADCTYLTDSAVVFLTNAAKGLRNLDLVLSLPPPVCVRVANGIVFLLRPLRYSNGSPLTRMPTPFYTKTQLLRLGGLRLLAPRNWPTSSRAPRVECAGMCQSYRCRRGGSGRRMPQPRGI